MVARPCLSPEDGLLDQKVAHTIQSLSLIPDYTWTARDYGYNSCMPLGRTRLVRHDHLRVLRTIAGRFATLNTSQNALDTARSREYSGARRLDRDAF